MESPVDEFLNYVKHELCNMVYQGLPVQDFLSLLWRRYEELSPLMSDSEHSTIKSLLTGAAQVIEPDIVIERVIQAMIEQFHVQSIAPEPMPRRLAKSLSAFQRWWTVDKNKFVLRKVGSDYLISKKHGSRGRARVIWIDEDSIVAAEVHLRMLKAGVEVVEGMGEGQEDRKRQR